MNRTQQILTGLLVVQIVAAVLVFMPQKTTTVSEPLFGELTVEQIETLMIEDNQGNSVQLERTTDGWILSNSDDYPANAETIEALLEKVVAIKTGRLIATSAESYKRLQVAEDDFARRVTFTTQDGEEHVLYVGSLAGSGATHVRAANLKEVYLTDAVTSYDFISQVKGWINAVYVAIPTEKMQRMTLENASGTLDFVNVGVQEAEWVMDGLAEDEEFNPNNLTSMLTRLTNLQMYRPLGKTELPEYGFDEPLAVVTLKYLDDADETQTLVLRVGALTEDGSYYYVHASVSEYYVEIPKSSMGDYVERSREVFLVIEEAEDD